MRPSTRARLVRASTAPMFAAALAFSVAGCQTPPRGPGASLAADPTDPCQSDRAAFASSKTYFQDQIVSAAVTGAAVGAGLGALTGLAATGNWRGALIGGLAGGAVGGVAGGTSAYYKTLAERAKDQDELAYDMNQDLARETQEIDHTAAAFGRLRACRFAHADTVKEQARMHMLDRPTALARIAYHRDKFNEELNIAHEFGLTMARRSQEFQQAANELRTRPPVTPQGAPTARAAPARVAQVDRAATVSVPEKRQSFDNTVASAQASSKAAFDLDNNAKLSLLLQLGLDA
jgi:outer membrane lipoprotein SlyB